MRMSDVKPSAELCSLSINASVATLTLERSDVYNALTVQLAELALCATTTAPSIFECWFFEVLDGTSAQEPTST